MHPAAVNPNIAPLAHQPATQTGASAKPAGGGDFAKLIGNYVQETNNAQITSDTAIHDLVTGKTDNVQNVVMAVANAEMSFQLFMEIRNKLIDSYNELMRMQF